jgi:hypothetical protein
MTTFELHEHGFDVYTFVTEALRREYAEHKEGYEAEFTEETVAGYRLYFLGLRRVERPTRRERGLL